MKFENDIASPPSWWSIFRGHLPVLVLAGAAIAVFFGLHSSATGVVVVAVVHLVVGLVIVAMQRFRRSRRPPGPAPAQAR